MRGRRELGPTGRRLGGLPVLPFWLLPVFLLVLTSLLSTPVSADTIIKKNGHRLVGTILEEEEGRVLIEVVSSGISAKLWVPRKEISRIEKGRTPLQEFEEKLGKLEPHDLDGHRELIVWARRNSLIGEAGRLEKKLPSIEIAARIHDHPRTWCRSCRADGIVECRACDGAGEIRPVCERCEGAGSIPCKVCKGKEGGQVRCRRCAGGGEVERFDPGKGKKVKERCRDCRGSGLRDCPRCEGKGHSPCALCDGKELEATPCETCEGKPKSACTVCGGKGIQPRPVSDAQLEKERAAAAAGEELPLPEGASAGSSPEKDPKPSPKPPEKPKPPIPNPFDDR